MGGKLSEHLTPAESQAALRNELSRERWRVIVRHLLRGCMECRAVLERGLQPAEPEPESAYDGALQASLDGALRKAYSSQDPFEGVMGVDKFQPSTEALATLESLLERSYVVRFDDPQEMVRLAREAIELALELDPADFGARRVVDQQVRAWGELANAYRVAEDLWEAERAFANAFKLLERSTGDRRLKARLFELHASLLGTQRKFAL